MVLAAGLSRRMGEVNKLLLELEGAPMVARCVDAVLASGHRLPVVVSHGQLPSLVLHSIDPSFGFEGWEPVPVGSRTAGASAFGVEDLVGNGWEWTSTPFAGYPIFLLWSLSATIGVHAR